MFLCNTLMSTRQVLFKPLIYILAVHITNVVLAPFYSPSPASFGLWVFAAFYLLTSWYLVTIVNSFPLVMLQSVLLPLLHKKHKKKTKLIFGLAAHLNYAQCLPFCCYLASILITPAACLCCLHPPLSCCHPVTENNKPISNLTRFLQPVFFLKMFWNVFNSKF